MRDGECEQDEGYAHHDLHHDNPPTLGAQDVYKGTPQRLYHPREVNKAGEEGHLSIRYAHAREQNNRDIVHNEVRNAFCKVECGYPKPRVYILCYILHFADIASLYCFRYFVYANFRLHRDVLALAI